MPTRKDAPLGAPCWIELGSSDIEASRKFYGELFGWASDAPNAEMGGYVSFTKDGHRVAGAMTAQEGQPVAWSVYLNTPDVRATVAAAEAQSAAVAVPPMDVADLGSMAFVVDPGGAMIGAWQPGTHKGIELLNEPGSPSWFELHTRAYDASVAFYKEVFKWDTHTASDEPGFRYTTQGTGENQTAGIMDASAFLPEGVPSHWSVYFACGDTDPAIAKAVGLGATLVMPAENTPYGRLATLSDPTGAIFKLIGHNVD